MLIGHRSSCQPLPRTARTPAGTSAAAPPTRRRASAHTRTTQTTWNASSASRYAGYQRSPTATKSSLYTSTGTSERCSFSGASSAAADRAVEHDLRPPLAEAREERDGRIEVAALLLDVADAEQVAAQREVDDEREDRANPRPHRPEPPQR